MKKMSAVGSSEASVEIIPSEGPEEETAFTTVTDYCQAIYETVRYLEKKTDAIDKKVSTIQRSRSLSIGPYAPFGSVTRKYNYLNSKRFKSMKRKKVTSEDLFSYPESYSPTSPVRKPEDNDTENDITGADFHSDDSQEIIPESPPEPVLSDTPPYRTMRSYTLQTFYRPNDNIDDVSQVARNRSTNVPSMATSFSAGTSTIVAPNALSHAPYSDMRNVALQRPQYNVGPLHRTDFARNNETEDPSTWTVDDVIMFMNRTDRHMASSLYDVIRKHEIDGKALLLLSHDIMIKYMGLKLGIAVKLSYYINQLKEDKELFN